MIRVYAVTRKKLYSGDIASSNKLEDLSSKADWLWIDCLNLDEKEIMTISNFLKIEAKILKEIKTEKHPSCERYRDYVLISIPFVEFGNTLQLHPISVIVKEKIIITSRDECSTKLIGKVIETLGSYVLENGRIGLSFIVGRLLREVANENSNTMMSLKVQIDKIEEKVLEKPGAKTIIRSVFKLKREIFTLHRLLWVEKELMSDVREQCVPHIKSDKETDLIIHDAIDDINRELEFVDSYSRTLDSILRLQDLGLIHRVERTLIFITIMILLLDAFLIIGEYILSTMVG